MAVYTVYTLVVRGAFDCYSVCDEFLTTAAYNCVCESGRPSVRGAVPDEAGSVC